MRNILVWLHRYLGLATARMDGPSLIERLEAEHPQRLVWYLEQPDEPGHSALLATVPRNDPASGQPYPLAPRVFYLDPANGQVLGEREWGACCFSRENLVPFILEFHYNLSLPGNWGIWLMGIIAILWTIDCLVSLWLTLPRGRPFWRKWGKAWKIKRQRLNQDLHRAGGLWLLLTPVAVSSVAMNLPAEVFKPVVSLFSEVPLSTYEARGRLAKEELGELKLDYRQAYALAREEGDRLGLHAPITELYYSFEYNFFGAGFGDHASDEGNVWVFVHGQDGSVIGREIPGVGTLGERFYQLQLPIHGGRILGFPGRVLIAVLGLAIAVLSVTGMVIWWRKQRARQFASQRVERGLAERG
ncbi:PepSY-associated TM helix domain-containing protein [Pseudomonas sp. BLCC-B13]|uniref:PepSY-associated TM helix domain-containing protein n=1 Tax=Pseudomonas sp. BLCC-B13 TaxID=3025314 RepID=UPI00234F14B7|nr:PepSY-associated TM helix domain-containing protein [Pseudomonas sp. BLCC-B13]MDC7825011.1 PepSY-associated TM helix domain-containing protein [Pseudomonas sp. BLCC-B13]